MIFVKKYIPKLLVLSFLLLLLPAEADAQRRFIRLQNRLEHDLRPYHFGFSLGVNTMNYAIRPVDDLRSSFDFDYVLPEPDFGFHIGIVSNLKLNRYMDLRFVPTISFGDRHLEYYLEDPNPGDPNTVSNWRR